MMFSSEIAFGAFISYSMEILGPRQVFISGQGSFFNVFFSGRSWIGVIANCTGSFGMVLCTLCAYLIKDWKLLMLISSLYMAISTILLYFCPESPRWLMTHTPEDVSRRKIIKFISLVDSNFESRSSELYEQIPKQLINTQNQRKGIVSPKILFSTK